MTSQTITLFQQQLHEVGKVDIRTIEGQMGVAARKVKDELETKISSALEVAMIDIQNVIMPESE